MAEESRKYVIVGGGAAAAATAVGVREVDADGSILIVCKEPRLPYDRPPLSKGFLKFAPADAEDIESKDPSFYTEKKIEVRTGVEAKSIDRGAHKILLSDGSNVTYEKLMLATGATPKRLNIKGADLANVFLLRNVDQASQIREQAKSARNVALIGAGFIGMEVGASLRQLGKNVTIIDPHPTPWSHFASPITGNFLRSFYERQGARFLLDDHVDEIGGDSKAEVVRTRSGHAAAADLVVVGIGVELNTSLASEAGLSLHEQGGVAANEFLQSVDDQDIYVAGDIAAYKDLSAGRRRHAEHYMNAKWTGNQAGRNMAGANEAYSKVAYFFSDMFDLSMVLRGDPDGCHSARILGDVDTGEFVELYVDGDDRVTMGLGFTREGDRYDPIVDGLERVILDHRKPRDVSAADVGLSA